MMKQESAIHNFIVFAVVMAVLAEVDARINALNSTLMEMGRAYVNANPTLYKVVNSGPVRALQLESLVYLAVGLFVVGILVPPAISSIETAATSGWNSATVTIFQVLLPVLAVIAIALYFFYQVRSSA